MKIVALTGNIGSGKSTFGSFLRAEGIPVIDLDVVGRTITETDPRARREMNRLVGLPEETSDRAKVREIIFKDPEKRKALEKFLHPLIEEEFNRETARLAKEGHKVVVCEAALLREVGFDKKAHELIVITAPKEMRWKRVSNRSNLTRGMFDQIDATQIQDNAGAIFNDGGEEALKAKALEIVKKWREATS